MTDPHLRALKPTVEVRVDIPTLPLAVAGP
jgi:hypothetical protein